jgi:hypothetical protein
MGAFTSGLGLGTSYVRNFRASITIPTQPTTYTDITGLSVGKNGQVLIGWDTQLMTHNNGQQAQVNTDVASGLSATQFSSPVTAVWTNVYKGYSIPAMQPYVIDANPQVAYDLSTATTNRVYLTYTDAPNTSQPNATNIYEIYSDNDGTSWSSPLRVNDETNPTKSHFMAADAVDPTNGNLAVAWYDARDDTNNVKVAVYGAVSINHGGSFGSNVLIAHLPNSSSVAQSNGTIANLESKGTVTGVDPNGGWLDDSGQDWTVSSDGPYDWWMQRGPYPVTFQVSVQLSPSGTTTEAISDNTKTRLLLTGGWNNGVPSVGSQYTISADNQSLGNYIGLAYYNNKFWPAWADNSNSTGDNPNINKHNPPNANDYQLNVYTVAVTYSTSPRSSAVATAAVPPSHLATSPSAVLTALLSESPVHAVPATSGPVPQQDASPLVAPVPALAPHPVDALFASMKQVQQPAMQPASRATEPDALDRSAQDLWQEAVTLGT